MRIVFKLLDGYAKRGGEVKLGISVAMPEICNVRRYEFALQRCDALSWEHVSEKVFVSQKRVSGFPEKRLTSGEVRGTSGEVRETSGEVWETSGEPLDCYSVPQ